MLSFSGLHPSPLFESSLLWLTTAVLLCSWRSSRGREGGHDLTDPHCVCPSAKGQLNTCEFAQKANRCLPQFFSSLSRTEKLVLLHLLSRLALTNATASFARLSSGKPLLRNDWTLVGRVYWRSKRPSEHKRRYNAPKQSGFILGCLYLK